MMLLLALIAAQARPNPFDRFDPAKLVISVAGQAVTVTDFPSMERCERAKASLEAQARAKAERDMPGYKIVSIGMTAYCIPA